MQGIEMGYLVEVIRKDLRGRSEGEAGKSKKVLMSGRELSEMLADRLRYYVLSAVSVDMVEYRLNYDSNEFEE